MRLLLTAFPDFSGPSSYVGLSLCFHGEASGPCLVFFESR